MMVIFLTGLVSMILMRTLRADYARYTARDEDDLEALERDVGDDIGRLGRVVGHDAADRIGQVRLAAQELLMRRLLLGALGRSLLLERQLRGRGMDPAVYLQMQGKTREELIEEAKPDALKELRRDSVLDAVVEAEGIEPTEEELIEAVRHTAEHHERTTPEKLLARLRRDGRDVLVAQDIQVRKALDLLSESAKPISMDLAEAREKLWTPS